MEESTLIQKQRRILKLLKNGDPCDQIHLQTQANGGTIIVVPPLVHEYLQAIFQTYSYNGWMKTEGFVQMCRSFRLQPKYGSDDVLKYIFSLVAEANENRIEFSSFLRVLHRLSKYKFRRTNMSEREALSAVILYLLKGSRVEAVNQHPLIQVGIQAKSEACDQETNTIQPEMVTTATGSTALPCRDVAVAASAIVRDVATSVDESELLPFQKVEGLEKLEEPVDHTKVEEVPEGKKSVELGKAAKLESPGQPEDPVKFEKPVELENKAASELREIQRTKSKVLEGAANSSADTEKDSPEKQALPSPNVAASSVIGRAGTNGKPSVLKAEEKSDIPQPDPSAQKFEAGVAKKTKASVMVLDEEDEAALSHIFTQCCKSCASEEELMTEMECAELCAKSKLLKCVSSNNEVGLSPEECEALYKTVASESSKTEASSSDADIKSHNSENQINYEDFKWLLFKMGAVMYSRLKESYAFVEVVKNHVIKNFYSDGEASECSEPIETETEQVQETEQHAYAAYSDSGSVDSRTQFGSQCSSSDGESDEFSEQGNYDEGYNAVEVSSCEYDTRYPFYLSGTLKLRGRDKYNRFTPRFDDMYN